MDLHVAGRAWRSPPGIDGAVEPVRKALCQQFLLVGQPASKPRASSPSIQSVSTPIRLTGVEEAWICNFDDAFLLVAEHMTTLAQLRFDIGIYDSCITHTQTASTTPTSVASNRFPVFGTFFFAVTAMSLSRRRSTNRLSKCGMPCLPDGPRKNARGCHGGRNHQTESSSTRPREASMHTLCVFIFTSTMSNCMKKHSLY